MSASLDLQQDFADTILQDFAGGGANVLETHLLGLLRQGPELRNHPTSDGLDVRRLQHQSALLVDEFQPRLAVDEVAALGELLHHDLALVALPSRLAADLLENIFQRDHPLRATVLIDYNGHGMFLLAKVF